MLISGTINRKSHDTCDLNLRGEKRIEREGKTFSDCTIERRFMTTFICWPSFRWTAHAQLKTKESLKERNQHSA